jgi:isopentenyl-diphosphate delta-isomerase
MLKSASSGEKAAIARLTVVIEELKNAMFLTGSRNLEALRNTPLIITGATYEWLTQRGFELGKYARRNNI